MSKEIKDVNNESYIIEKEYQGGYGNIILLSLSLIIILVIIIIVIKI